LSFCAVTKKMDLYKNSVIKSHDVVNSGKTLPLSSIFSGGCGNHEEEISDPERQVQKKSQDELARRLSEISDEYYRKGFAEGAEFQKKEFQPTLEAVTTLIRTIPLVRKEMIEDLEEKIVQLALAVAEKILNQEVLTRKDVIMGVLKGALKNVADAEGMKIRLHQDDFRYMMEIKQDFLQSIDGVRNVVFEEDASMKKGGAVVETMFGEVDARLENQLKEIKEAILEY